jgi:hypothetical protein
MSQQHYEHALAWMERAVSAFAARVPPPRQVPYKDGYIYRYVEMTLPQALVQKLARTVSTLTGARLLMEQGFVQEQATLQRVLDELHEDISFLSYGRLFGETDLHQAYLASFYEEEFDADSAIESTQKRAMVPRKKIRAWLSNLFGEHVEPTKGVELSRTLSKTYSGYVHAASPQIMDIYFGDPPRFHMTGVKGTFRQDEHRTDLWNYFYRSILSFADVAKAFGDESLFESIRAYSLEFAKANGKDYGPHAT